MAGQKYQITAELVDKFSSTLAEMGKGIEKLEQSTDKFNKVFDERAKGHAKHWFNAKRGAEDFHKKVTEHMESVNKALEKSSKLLGNLSGGFGGMMKFAG